MFIAAKISNEPILIPFNSTGYYRGIYKKGSMSNFNSLALVRAKRIALALVPHLPNKRVITVVEFGKELNVDHRILTSAIHGP